MGRVRAGLLPAIALASIAVAPAANSEDYPSRSVDLIVPFATGGGTDLLARILSEGLSKRLGQSFIVLNRPGANTNIGTLFVVRSKPDGYTLVMASIGLAANPSLYKALPFEPLNDLAPISLIANAPTVLVVNTSLPVNSVADLIVYLKNRPNAVAYASYGVGSGPHLAAELLQFTTGTKILHVPYAGGAPAAYAVVGNNVQMLFSSVLPVLGLIRSGSVKPLAVAANHRLALLPEVPTFLESGVSYQMGTWFGLLAPAKTPDAVISTLHKATLEVLHDEDTRAKILEQGAEVVGNSPANFRAFIKEETDRLSIVIRSAKIALD
ncbi:MAG: tripartite tricarboxylate transporter substrate binding protein [Bradyrhizobiaceae bacterium]|nr:tripartite tricarboxylate transporter substrate binding protein [Bradyrhizobiaceae bacterium]